MRKKELTNLLHIGSESCLSASAAVDRIGKCFEASMYSGVSLKGSHALVIKICTYTISKMTKDRLQKL